MIQQILFIEKKMLKVAQKLRGKTDTRLPITKEILFKLTQAICTVIPVFYNQILLKAMMVLAFYCFLRVGEMTLKSGGDHTKIIQLSDIQFESAENQLLSMTVTIRNYKHSDLQPKKIVLHRNNQNLICPVSVMGQYVSLVKHSHGPLFCFICGTPASYFYFNSSLKSFLLRFVGLSPDLYKGHSFRIGAATSAAARGVTLSVIQNLGRWKSNAFKNYIRMDNL